MGLILADWLVFQGFRYRDFWVICPIFGDFLVAFEEFCQVLGELWGDC